MNRPFVKICGITNLHDGRMSLEYGADILGFNFFNKSSRYIDPEKAGNIIKSLRKDFSFKSAGVFVNPSKDQVDDVISIADLDMLQFHGEESASFIKGFSKTILKAFRIKDRSDILKCREYDPDTYILLDTFSKKSYGGTGEAFDWNVLADIDFRSRLFLSGGINSGNIYEAIKRINPYAVDLCSGLEKSPGIKDPDKVMEFSSIINKIKYDKIGKN